MGRLLTFCHEASKDESKESSTASSCSFTDTTNWKRWGLCDNTGFCIHSTCLIMCYTSSCCTTGVGSLAGHTLARGGRVWCQVAFVTLEC